MTRYIVVSIIVYKHTNIQINAKTIQSTRLDYQEIEEEKKLGEGSFGIVFLGSYRGNKVAIKKMKQITDENEGNSMMEEFENEVAMLDKFRCDYIVHFYGAVFIPKKICMVTEFAQYGSLKDLMKKQPDGEGIEISMRVKFMLDSSRGIQYLHENGILHRDIKPDNFLVVSLDRNVKVNCKLTDFGSSRNINLLMTNMTFTKGVGTPAFMAPEILNRKKYKKTADIFSFSITMLECITWKEAYPKTIYKFAWDIADAVSQGKRPETINQIENNQIKQLIEQCWCQQPKDRLSINSIVQQLESIYSYQK